MITFTLTFNCRIISSVWKTNCIGNNCCFFFCRSFQICAKALIWSGRACFFFFFSFSITFQEQFTSLRFSTPSKAFSDWVLTVAFLTFFLGFCFSQLSMTELTMSLLLSGALMETFMMESSILLFSWLRNFVFVMLMTLLPLSGQALLQGEESPTSATNSISSKI